MRFLETLQKLDRRIIFIVIALTVIIPMLLKPVFLPIDISPSAQGVYDAIESLPAGTKVLFPFDYDPTASPELNPAALALLDHCFRKDLKIVALTLTPYGVPLADAILKVKAEKYNKIYGKDYIHLGYKSGYEITIQKMGISIPEVFPQDKNNKPISDFSIMKKVKNYKDFGLIVSLSAGYPGTKEYVMFAHGPYHIKIVAAVTAVSAPEFFSYYNTGQLEGLLGGMKGAAEYEKLVGVLGTATKGMIAQSTSHLAVIIFVIIANIVYFGTKKRKD